MKYTPRPMQQCDHRWSRRANGDVGAVRTPATRLVNARRCRAVMPAFGGFMPSLAHVGKHCMVSGRARRTFEKNGHRNRIGTSAQWRWLAGRPAGGHQRPAGCRQPRLAISVMLPGQLQTCAQSRWGEGAAKLHTSPSQPIGVAQEFRSGRAAPSVDARLPRVPPAVDALNPGT